jgi:hypothetical protein
VVCLPTLMILAGIPDIKSIVRTTVTHGLQVIISEKWNFSSVIRLIDLPRTY